MQYLSKEQIKSCFISTVKYLHEEVDNEDIPACIDAILAFMNTMAEEEWKEI